MGDSLQPSDAPFPSMEEEEDDTPSGIVVPPVIAATMPPPPPRKSKATTPASSKTTTAGDRLQAPPATTSYQSFPPEDGNPNNAVVIIAEGTSDIHRGFSTSIHSVLDDERAERVACCASTCCGVLQSDRDRYLLTGVHPPSLGRRLWLHVGLPILIFLLAGTLAMRIRNAWVNQFVSTVLVLTIFAYMALQCQKGRHKHIRVRKELLWTKHQLRQQPGVSVGEILGRRDRAEPDDDAYDEQLHEYYRGHTVSDFWCAHPYCCGFYKRDDRDPIVPPNSLAAQLFRWFFPARGCCWSGWHLQCCGICGLAQEGRELERLIPASFRSIDYITMEPYAEYYPAVFRHKWNQEQSPSPSSTENDLEGVLLESSPSREDMRRRILGRRRRRSREPWLQKWFPPLSRLSTRLLECALGFSALLLVWSVLAGPYWSRVARHSSRGHAFGIVDFIIYACALGQAVGLLALLKHLVDYGIFQRPAAQTGENAEASTGRNHTSMLSVDALVKFFASGFVLSVVLAVFWESVLSVLMKVIIMSLLAIFGIEVELDPQVSGSIGFGQNQQVYHGMLQRLFAAAAASGGDEVTETPTFLQAFGRDHPVAGSIILFLEAFVMAAFVEEVCKYFGYRMVEHPDFLPSSELEQASMSLQLYGSARDAETDDDDASTASANNSNPPAVVASNSSSLRPTATMLSELDAPDYQCHRQSIPGHAAAIRLAMMAVAMGFTCCENLVYVFLYSGGESAKMELTVLLGRSLFPVHPICAALQSLRVVERDILRPQENTSMSKTSTTPVGLGAILLPAVLFHGGYDFFILWIDFLANRAREVNQDGLEDAISVLVSLTISVVAMVGALVYYCRHAARQRARLLALDAKANMGVAIS